MEKKTRQAKVTPEHIEEAKKLLALWEKRATDTTQAAFGVENGIGGQAAVWQFLNGRTPISLKAAQAFAVGLKCDVADFSPRLAQDILERSRWPFKVMTPEQWSQLNETTRTETEQRLLGALLMQSSGEIQPAMHTRTGTDR